MKIMIDTNILISAVLFPKGKASRALQKSLLPPYQPMISDYILEEFKNKFSEKFPDEKEEMEAFLKPFLCLVSVVETPETEEPAEGKIRDPKDRPIIRAAIKHKVDLFLTGDKDFLESTVDNPQILSADEFLKMYV